MTLQEAAQQALEALEYFDSEYDVKDEITALRAAIAEASGQDVQQEMEQEPVAQVVEQDIKYHGYARAIKHLGTDLLPVGVKLYTRPPRREWVSLTDEAVRDLWEWSATAEAERTANTQQHAFARAIEAKLKEKNS